jgi:hypothetical protein
MTMILELRRGYLINGGSPLKQWEMMKNRFRSASRSARNAAELATWCQRHLQIPSDSPASKGICSATRELSDYTTEDTSRWRRTRQLLDQEWTLVEALCRREVEVRKAAKAEEEEDSNA